MEKENKILQERNFKETIIRIYNISKEHYNSDIDTHIQSIYNRLTDLEQAIFLRGIIPLLFASEENPEELIELDKEENFNIDNYNKVELIRLKTWLIKSLIIFLGIFFSIVLVYILLRTYSPNPHEGDGLFDNISSFIDILKEL